MTERDKLRDKVRSIYCDGKYMTIQSANQAIADFIIEDRRRIIEPLVAFCAKEYPSSDDPGYAIRKTLKNAGIQ